MMQFLQPSLLWGTLAVAIPIAIHLWHQKKGRTIAWAATQWLFEKSQQSQRGLRLDQLLLLALRCLILIVLALLLSEPFIRNDIASAPLQKVHLVQPEAFVVDNYRFELEEAQQRGETIYWLLPTPEPADGLVLPATAGEALSPVQVQAALNRLTREGVALHLYLKNERSLAQLPRIQTPLDFQLHAVSDTLSRQARPYWLVANSKKLYIDADNRLRSGSAEPGVTFAAEQVGKGPLRVWLDLENPDEQKTVEAALRALAEVYDLELAVGEETTGRSYDVSISRQVPASPQPTTLYVVTGQVGGSAFPNVLFTPDALTPQASPMVAKGQLPEWLGQQILNHVGLSGDTPSLTQAELATLFKPMKPTSGESSAGTQYLFFMILLVFVCAERALALTRNA
jgi:hypothetical protein